VNAVLPSTIDTAKNRGAIPDADASRWVQPESIAAVIEFLLSDAARDVSGAVLPVHGAPEVLPRCRRTRAASERRWRGDSLGRPPATRSDS